MAKDGGFVSTSSAGLLDYVNGENTFYRRGCFLRSYDKEEEEDVKRGEGERKKRKVQDLTQNWKWSVRKLMKW